MLAALLISLASLVAALGFFAFTLSTLQRMLHEKQQTEDRLVDSERHLQSIIDSATALIFVTDLEGRLVLVNRAFEGRLGAGRVEAIGKTMEELFCPAVAAALMSHEEGVVAPGGSLEYDLEIELPAGARSYFATRFPLGDSAGRPYAVCRVLTDVTERMQMVEERIRIFDLSLDMMCVTGFDGYQTQTNPQFTRVLGYSVEEMQSRPFFEFVHPEDVSAARSAVERLGQGEDLVDFANRAICKDGSEQWISWRISADVEEGQMICVGRPIEAPDVSYLESSQVPGDLPLPAERIVSLREAKAKRDTH